MGETHGEEQDGGQTFLQLSDPTEQIVAQHSSVTSLSLSPSCPPIIITTNQRHEAKLSHRPNTEPSPRPPPPPSQLAASLPQVALSALIKAARLLGDD